MREISEHNDDRSLIEIYAPIYRTGSREVIAVGELYEEAEEFTVQRNRAQRHTWAIVGATTLAIMGLLFLIVRRASSVIESQRVTLKSQLANAQALAEQNKKLRKVADHARMDATKSNETLLNRIGSDLHDGPVQLLSLLILRLGGGSSDPTKGSDLPKNAPQELHPSRLASQVLTELRELSTGTRSARDREHIARSGASCCCGTSRVCDRVSCQRKLRWPARERCLSIENLPLPCCSRRAQQCVPARFRIGPKSYGFGGRKNHYCCRQRCGAGIGAGGRELRCTQGPWDFKVSVIVWKPSAVRCSSSSAAAMIRN